MDASLFLYHTTPHDVSSNSANQIRRREQRVQGGGDSIGGDFRFHHNFFTIRRELFKSKSRSHSQVRVSGFVGGLL